MLKTTTRIFTGSVMAALLISLNTGAFACEQCVETPAATSAKTAVKATKRAAKTVVAAKMTPKGKTNAKAKIAPIAAKKNGVKLVALQGASAEPAVKMCPMCEKAAANAKK